MTGHDGNACYVMGVLTPIDGLARCLTIGALLDVMTRRFGGYEVVAHWTLGELHHDIVVMLPASATVDLPGRVLVVSANGEGGIKEVLCFAEVPDRSALWHERCPEALEFSGELEPVLGRATTQHWFDPRELLKAAPRDAQPEPRRAPGKGAAWERDEPPTQRSR